MRRFMMRIAEKGRGRGGLLALITGESLTIKCEQETMPKRWPSPARYAAAGISSARRTQGGIIRIARKNRQHVRGTLDPAV